MEQCLILYFIQYSKSKRGFNRTILEKETTVSLSDICHSPLKPTVSICNIQGIWAYWQDDPKELEKETNRYIEQWLLCNHIYFNIVNWFKLKYFISERSYYICFFLSTNQGLGTRNDNGHDKDTYLDHFLLCSRNPTNPQTQTGMKQSCMSKGGIPVQPYYVLGGFNGSRYSGKCSYL